MNDTVGDLITRIRNAHMVNLKFADDIPHSALRVNVLEAMLQEGYISGYEIKDPESKIKKIIVELKYFKGSPVIKEITRVSKPGRRVYSSIKSLSQFYHGMGTIFLSTPKGILSDFEARKQNVAGEVLFKVF